MVLHDLPFIIICVTSNHSWYFTYITEQNLCHCKGKSEQWQSIIKLKQWQIFQIFNLNQSNNNCFWDQKKAVFKTQAKTKAVYWRMKQKQCRRTRIESLFLIYRDCYNDDFSLKSSQTKAWGFKWPTTKMILFLPSRNWEALCA